MRLSSLSAVFGDADLVQFEQFFVQECLTYAIRHFNEAESLCHFSTKLNLQMVLQDFDYQIFK